VEKTENAPFLVSSSYFISPVNEEQKMLSELERERERERERRSTDHN